MSVIEETTGREASEAGDVAPASTSASASGPPLQRRANVLHPRRPRQEDYRIRLENFLGPLDLLLHLIRRTEVDILDIPIHTITEQYLSVLEAVDDVDIEQAGEFLVLAATLIEIKSRTLAPNPEGESDGADGDSPKGEAASGGGAIDPRYELVQQLLAYQRFRDAAESLDHRRVEFLSRFPVRPMRRSFERDEAAENEVALELDDVHVLDLAEAYERIAASIDFTRLGEHHVEFDDTPIELHEEDLLDRLTRASGHAITLQDAFTGQNRAGRIGLFLATLELTRMRRIRVKQDEIDEDILIQLNENAEDALVIESDAINRDRAGA